MNKKTIALIVASLCVMVIIVACMVCAFWRPYTLEDSNSIILQIGEKNVLLTQQNKDFIETHNLIKQLLNSARFSIIFANEQVKMKCTDENVANEKKSNDIWIELLSDTGKYRKIFFVMKKDNEKQFIRLFVTQTKSYDNGFFLSYNNCNCKQLIKHLVHMD